MLKGIPPILTPQLLKVLMEMGHDDALVLADANFTAERLAGSKPVIRLPGVEMLHMVQAITTLLPLATDVDCPAAYMAVSGQPEGYRSALQRAVCQHLEPILLPSQRVESVERYAFYNRVTTAYAIVVTGELQPFGNFILRKGVIGDNLRP